MSNLALFDFDGTITWSDTWTPFMRFAISPGRLVAGQALLAPVVVGHRLGLVSSSRGRQIAARVGFQGQDVAAVHRLGVEYATTRIPGTLRRSMLERLEWHRSRGDEIVVVSASLDVYLGPWCETRGMACICTTLEERNGRLTGRYARGDCSGAEKARRIRERYELDRYSMIYAYGDSGEDRQMLDLAHKKYYRGIEISDWSKVTSHGHPRADRARESGG